MINLLPPDLKSSIHYARINTSLFQYSFISAVVVVLVAGVMFFGYTIADADENALRDNITQKEAELSQLVQVEEDAGSLADSIDTVGKLLDREVKFSETVQEIGAILPDGSVLSSLTLDIDTTIPLRIEAVVDTKEIAAVLRQNIEDSERYSIADIESITSNVDADGNDDGFKVIIVAKQADNSVPTPTPAANTDGGGGNN